ncbi:lysine-specific demethylase ELF6 isoform X2 [Apium graveolens]|uniref:lysine-specific demethylase ELF6 isoform X2 n=1 Tax=Apium graveolens TaxID=4045 RepID=UPI003D796443
MRDVKIPNWLSGLPLAPEFRPTDTEFADPIAYISKIEKEASAFGICKVIPPYPRPSKRFVIGNLNKSLSKCPELGLDVNLEDVKVKGISSGEGKAVFTTRQQELGKSGKRTRGDEEVAPSIYKQVWQSGEVYTLEQFEAKAKSFARSQLGMVKNVSALVIESLFWKAALEKPIYVEYANDVPGSGFGEPEGSGRRRIINEDSSENNKELREIITSSDENKFASIKFNPLSVATSSSHTSDHIARTLRERSSGQAKDIECSSGQKLSNSPWNLQVIAQSPGSVTRFMPDDIPGVTSPMVYIGMLFSWFAWHVEDHELHSLNFLHTGSPKTWYAVPEDHAINFEEVIRKEAYGGNIDRLAALTLLGEKTTLLSPKVIVASGIPCCRLVQNPGEFVITFPRAYHVGFSHGFNCGEAANFGTPKWLTFAKEAAVRRAAMNHLPMLSHQQLLYLLTMSFISRVPRSLTAGVRSSRLRDRQKEEREILVKKAFVEDIINENTKLAVLLQKNSSYRAVLWDLEMLAFSPGGSDLVNSITDMSRLKKNISTETNHKHDLYSEYENDADLSSEFQVDSGALPCVACGLLGFPFMSVLQPSKKALEGILSAHPAMSNSSLFFNRMVDVSVSGTITNHNTTVKDRILSACERNVKENTEIVTGGEIDVEALDVEDEVRASSLLVQNPTGACSSKEKTQSMCCLEDFSPSTSININDGPSTYLRPRIFCLEHAIQVEELLSGKGGADLLVICHSDFKKIKLHAAAVADEIGSPFSYQEVPLDNASPEDLKFINFAIDDEGQDESREDWTSTVKINLRHCLELFKKFPSEELQHALTLKGLCFDKAFGGSPPSFTPSFKWNSTKFRSKRRKLNQSEDKSSVSMLMKKDETSDSVPDVPLPKKQVKLVHYVRRFKSKNSSCSVGASKITEDPQKNLLPVDCADLNENKHNDIAEDISLNKNTGSGSFELTVLVPSQPSDMQQESKCIVETRNISKISVPSQMKLNLLYAKPVTENDTSQSGNSISKELAMTDEACGLATFGSLMQQGIKLVGNSSEKNGKCSEASSGSPEVAVKSTVACQITKYVQVERETQMAEGSSSQHVNFNLVNAGTIGGMCDIPDKIDVSMKEVSDPTICVVPLSEVERFNKHTEKPLSDVNIGADSCANFDNEVQSQFSPTKEFSDPTISEGSSSDFTTVERSSEQIEKPLEEVNFGVEYLNLERELQPQFASKKEISDSVTSEVTDSDISKVERLNEQIQIVEVKTGANNCQNLEFEVQPDFASAKESKDSATAYVKPRPLNKSSPISVKGIRDSLSEESAPEKIDSKGEISPLQDLIEFDGHNSEAQPDSVVKNNRRRKREAELLAEGGSVSDGFIRSPCEGLRPRTGSTVLEERSVRKVLKEKPETKKVLEEKPVAKKILKEKTVTKTLFEEKPESKKARDSSEHPSRCKNGIKNRKASYNCDIENCKLSYETKEELRLHKNNQCPHEGCDKTFNTHKNAVLHVRVHDDARPLKCPWKGCTKSFKWAWARTEHIRVHTGEKPYKCKVEGCGREFRFVSDYSRHRRKTGHDRT